MNAVDQSVLARLRGDGETERRYLLQALEFERAAADTLLQQHDQEPSRSVLFRSAATLALRCKNFRLAEKLVSVGLSGEPPAEIADELRDILEQVYFERHLAVRGIQLLDRELQMSLAGDAVGFGSVESELFVTKLKTFEKLLYRTAERKLKMPYREQAAASAGVKRDFEVFLSAPRAASFAVTIKIGQHGEQGVLPFDGVVSEVLDELMRGLKAVDDNEPETLKRLIPEKKYYRNFVGLARQLAPDRESISQIGFTVQTGEQQHQQIALRRPRSEIVLSRYNPSAKNRETRRKRIEIIGSLKFADETNSNKPRIKIVADDGHEHTVIVPEGMMGDIVRPLWGQRVRITGWLEDQTRISAITLDDIEESG